MMLLLCPPMRIIRRLAHNIGCPIEYVLKPCVFGAGADLFDASVDKKRRRVFEHPLDALDHGGRVVAVDEAMIE